MRKFLQIILNRVVITAFIVLVQIGFFLLEIFQWANHYVEIAMVLRIISVIAVCYLIWKPNNPAVKLAWIVPILVFPLFGGILYLVFGHVIISRKLRNSMRNADELLRRNMPENVENMRKLREENQAIANQSLYLQKYSGMPVWENTKTLYFSEGIQYWRALLADLEKAERFIFLEYFILGEGAMWNEILKILERKVKAGVDVRLIYDDVGSAFKLPKHYDQYIEEKGIKCVAFNRLVPFMSLILNNRDHRKIAVIDGKTGYTGGINLADEYINYEAPYNEWKDAGIRLEGEAVWSFTVMFLQIWNISRPTDEDYGVYRYHFKEELTARGFVQPYGDTPFDNESVGSA